MTVRSFMLHYFSKHGLIFLFIPGEQIAIQNCENATIYLFDHINTLTIDDCIGCKILTGPTKVSKYFIFKRY